MKHLTLSLIGLLGLAPLITIAGNQFQALEEMVSQIDQAHVESLYIVGNHIQFTAPIMGDLITAGQILTIDETIDEDLWAAGETITINADIQDDVRVAGETIIINGIV